MNQKPPWLFDVETAKQECRVTNVSFRIQKAKEVGIGFDLPSVAPSAPNFVEGIGEEVLV